MKALMNAPVETLNSVTSTPFTHSNTVSVFALNRIAATGDELPLSSTCNTVMDAWSLISAWFTTPRLSARDIPAKITLPLAKPTASVRRD